MVRSLMVYNMTMFGISKKKIVVYMAIFLLSRLIFLGNLPIFNDESIFLQWGRSLIFHYSPDIPMSLDGKNILTPVLFGSFQKLPVDPLIAGRLVSVVFSLGTCLSFIIFGNVLAGKRGSFYGFLFATLMPFSVLFDRLAMPDGIVLFGSATLLALTLLYIKKEPWWGGIVMGVVFAISWLTKTSVMLLIPVLLCLYIWYGITQKKYFSLAAHLFSIVATVLVFTVPVYLHPLYVSGYVPVVRASPISELLRFPWSMWASNGWAIVQWVFFGSGLLPVIGIWFIFQCKHSIGIGMFSGLIISIIGLAIISPSLSARYIIALLPPMAAIGILGIVQIEKTWGLKISHLTIGFLLTLSMPLLISPLFFYKLLVFSPATQSDFGQYVRGWTSGYGVKETVSFLKKKHKEEGNITIFLRFDSGNPEDAIRLYLGDEVGFRVLTIAPDVDAQTIFEKYATTGNNYFISRGGQVLDSQLYLKEMAHFPKPLDEEFIGVYKIILP